MKLWKRILLAASIFFLCCFIVLQCLIVAAPYQNRAAKSEYILVLGYALVDGAYPDGWLQQRLKVGLDLYKGGYGEYIVVSGGKGKKDHIPVAQAMKRWLIAHGIPSEKVLTEEQSGTTYENMLFSKKIISDQPVVVVTNDFHIFRSMMIARKFFKNCTGAPAASTGSVKRFGAYIRENLATWKYIVFERQFPLMR